MTEQQTNDEPWREVGKQFQALGQSMADAFRAAWENEENRQQLRDLQDGLEKMVNDVGQALKQASESPEGQRVQEEAKRAAQSARAAGAKAWQDARPHVVSALRQLNAELQKVVGKLEKEPGE
jgi:MoxR-like ATPase